MKELKQHPHQARQQLAKQRQGEMVAKGAERSRLARAKKNVSNTNAGVEFRDRYLDAVNEQLRAMLKPYDEQGKGNKPKWYKAIKAVDTRLTAALAINCFVDAAQKGLSMTAAREQAGKNFVALLFDQLVYGTGEREKAFERFKAAMMQKMGDTYRRTDMFLARAEHLGFDSRYYANRNMLRNIGSALQDSVTQAGLLDWEKFKKGDDKKATRYLELSQEVLKAIEERNEKHFDLQSPMFSANPVQPNEWYPHEDGWSRSGPYDDAMLNFRTHFVRHMSDEQKADVEERIENGKMDKILEAVHHIQNTPYNINEYVLRAVQWVDEGRKGGDLKSWPNIEQVPVETKLTDDVWAAMSPDERSQWTQDKNDKVEANAAARGNTTMLHRYTAAPNPKDSAAPVGEAEKLLDDGDFYMPHNCDSRGRIYHINDFGHHDTDYIRAQFVFAKKQLVTEENVAWLYLQLANTYGNKMDKLDVQDHATFYEENKDAILACGADFKTSFDIWSEASEPFQFIAACRELYLYEQAKANGEDYSTGLPIAVDASQSGVQHLALSLLHTDNCERVNLSDSKTRRDIYEDCLVVAKRLFAEDKIRKTQELLDDPVTDDDRQQEAEVAAQLAEKDEDNRFVLKDRERRRLRRRWSRSDARQRLKKEKELEVIDQLEQWSGDVVMPYGRSVIKRQVMTYCYSSRQFGFANQLRADWMDKLSEKLRHGKIAEHPFGADKGFAASIYIAGVHERAIVEVVTSAETGMKFIRDIASILAKSEITEQRPANYDDLTDDEKKEYRTHNENGVHLKFVTPHMQFPMYQHYVQEFTKDQQLTFFDRPLKAERQEGENSLGFTRTEWLSVHETDDTKLWVEKSINASAPNIVHAMDATHLMMTVLECKKRGVESVMVVHDSFAAGIGDMLTLSEALRDTLIELYRDYNLYHDLLSQNKQRLFNHLSKKWAAEELARIKGNAWTITQQTKIDEAVIAHIRAIDWPEVPNREDFDIEQIKDSLYSFL